MFGTCPPLRCCAQVDGRPGRVCGELATAKRPSTHWFDARFFCDKHRSPSDEPIAGDQVVRRVRLTCDVLLAGVTSSAPGAQAEAVARLEAAVRAIGGVLEVDRVHSTFGRYPAQAASPDGGGVMGGV